MIVVYDKTTCNIEKGLDESQDYNVYFTHHPQSFRDNLDIIYVDKPPKNLGDYRVENGQMVKKSEQEIFENKKYGKVLTYEEKQDIIDRENQAKQKTVESQATESFAKMSFRMMAPTLTTTQVLQFEPLVEDWKLGIFIIGDIRKHLGQVWKCVQEHNNINNPDIEPSKSPAQWSPYHSKDIKYAKPYIQPQGSHDSYMKDEYCIFEAKTYKSIIDNNVWTPTGYPQGWLLI